MYATRPGARWIRTGSPPRKKRIPSGTRTVTEATKVRLEAVAYLPGTNGSNPIPSSGESVSAVNSGAVGEKPGAFAPVCTANGTREGDELAEHPLIWPFLSEGH